MASPERSNGYPRVELKFIWSVTACEGRQNAMPRNGFAACLGCL